MRQVVSAEYAKTAYGNGMGSALTQTFDVTDHIVIDVPSDKIYRSRESRQLKHFKEDSNEIIEIPNVEAYSGRSIVTPEHFIQFSPDQVWSEFTVLEGHPEAMKKRTAFRKAAEAATRLGLADLTIRATFSNSKGTWSLGFFVITSRLL